MKEKKKKLFSQSDSLRPGDSIIHPDFGQGLIISLAENIATVAFKKKGLKKLDLGLAAVKKM